MTLEGISYLNKYKELLLGATITVDDMLIDDDATIAFNLYKNKRVIKYKPGLPWRLCDNERVIIGWADTDPVERSKRLFSESKVFVQNVVYNDLMDLFLFLSDDLILETYITVTEYNKCWSLKDMEEEYYELIVTGEGIILIENGEAYEI